MAPKPAQKPKIKKETTPPPSPKSQPKPAATPASAKKPKKEAPILRNLPKDKSAPVPVDVSYDGTSAVSKLEASGDFSHSIRLSASGSFTLIKTVMLQGGDYDGMQAIIIRPAKAFNFSGLPEEVRVRIYREYFAPSSIKGSPIPLEGKRKSNNEVYAKTYADGSKNRVALLAVNKEICAKALPILYSHDLKFESTSTLMEFLSNVKDIRPHLTSVTVKTWIKTTSKTAMGILAESPRLACLTIEAGIHSEGDPNKAAKVFYDHAYKFLEAVGAVKGDPAAGVDVLHFGKAAFKYKDDKKVERPWSAQLVEEFRDALRAKLKPSL